MLRILLSLAVVLAWGGVSVAVAQERDPPVCGVSSVGTGESEVIVVPLVATNVVARATNVWPAAVAPAVREFEAKCAAKTATRGDLIALKKFIAASAIDGAAKTNVTKRVRKMYQESRKK